MGQSIASIRSGIASKIESISGFQESKQTPDYFGRTQDTIAHLGFTVQCNTSTASEDRQRRAVGVYLNTQFRVIFAYRFRPLDAYPTDYDLALDQESTVIRTVLEAYATNNKFTIRYNGSSRVVTESQEFVIITTDFIANHTI